MDELSKGGFADLDQLKQLSIDLPKVDLYRCIAIFVNNYAHFGHICSEILKNLGSIDENLMRCYIKIFNAHHFYIDLYRENLLSHETLMRILTDDFYAFFYVGPLLYKDNQEDFQKIWDVHFRNEEVDLKEKLFHIDEWEPSEEDFAENIAAIIRKDDADAFTQYITTHNIPINDKFQIKEESELAKYFYEDDEKEAVTFLEYAAYYDSIEIFRNIIERTGTENLPADLYNLVVISGDRNLLEYAPSPASDYYAKAVGTALQYHQNEMMQWVIDNSPSPDRKQYHEIAIWNENFVGYLTAPEGQNETSKEEVVKEYIEHSSTVGNLQLLKYIINKNANKCTVERVLHNAADGGFMDIFNYIVENNLYGDINYKELNHGETALMRAVFHNQPQMVQKLLGLKANSINENDDKQNLLHLAAAGNSIESLQELTKSTDLKSLVNKQDKKKYTPLLIALRDHFVEMAKEILKFDGIDVSILSWDGQNAIHYASQLGYADVLTEILSKNKALDYINVQDEEKNTPLHLASKNGHTEVVQILISHGANVNIKNKDNFPPINFAAMRGHTQIVDMLIKAGADYMVHDNSSFAPIHWACTNNELDTIKYLCEVNPKNVNLQRAPGTDGAYPLHVVAQYGYVEAVKYFLSRPDLQINNQDDIRRTPLITATDAQEVETVSLIVQHPECDVNVKDLNEMTALHNACTTGPLELVKAICKKEGIDVNIQAKDSFTPLHCAAQAGHKDIVQYLVEEMHANLEAKATFDLTPLALAEREGKNDVAEYLRSIGK